jgi:hypothetical protein
MTKLSFLLVGVLAVAGCKKKAGGADCDAAINHSMELSKAEMSKMPGVDDAMMGKMKDVGIQHCKDDKWSADATKCMVDAKTIGDAQACYGKLTQDQRDKMNKAAMELAPAPTPTPTEGAAGSGAPAQGSQGSEEIASGAAPSEQPAAGSAGSAAAGSAGSAAH